MADPRMQTMLCTVHNLHFAFEMSPSSQEAEHVPCPRCAREDAMQAKRELGEALRHRALLLEAIDLKRLIVPAGGGSHG